MEQEDKGTVRPPRGERDTGGESSARGRNSPAGEGSCGGAGAAFGKNAGPLSGIFQHLRKVEKLETGDLLLLGILLLLILEGCEDWELLLTLFLLLLLGQDT